GTTQGCLTQLGSAQAQHHLPTSRHNTHCVPAELRPLTPDCWYVLTGPPLACRSELGLPRLRLVLQGVPGYRHGRRAPAARGTGLGQGCFDRRAASLQEERSLVGAEVPFEQPGGRKLRLPQRAGSLPRARKVRLCDQAAAVPALSLRAGADRSPLAG